MAVGAFHPGGARRIVRLVEHHGRQALAAIEPSCIQAACVGARFVRLVKHFFRRVDDERDEEGRQQDDADGGGQPGAVGEPDRPGPARPRRRDAGARERGAPAVRRPEEGGDVEGRAQAEGALSQALGKLFALAEAYPDLVRECLHRGHQLGTHGWAHGGLEEDEDFRVASYEQQRQWIEEMNAAIAKKGSSAR